MQDLVARAMGQVSLHEQTAMVIWPQVAKGAYRAHLQMALSAWEGQ